MNTATKPIETNQTLMKKIFKLFAAALLIAGATACSGSKGEGENSELSAKQKIMLKGLELEVSKINKSLPLETGEGLTLTKMAIEDGYLVSTCTYDEGGDIEVDDSDSTKTAIIEAAGESAVARLKELNMGLKYVYIEDGTGTEQTITITPEEL